MARVLLVDDEATVRRVLELALGRAGHDVVTAANGEAALAEIRAHPPDVLITDLEMPRMGGWELCEALEAEMPERSFPIFVVTSLAERAHRRWSARMRDLHFLEKPISARNLLSRIDARLVPQPEGI